tara:strand:+ start:766 stop:1176 length:411 start_codon:yes stop_codon:yes gene_type:complete
MSLNNLTQNINKWIFLNDKIEISNKKMKELKEQKNTIEESIIHDMEEKNLTNKKLRLNNTHILYNISHNQPGISITLLESIFDELITNNTISIETKKYIIEYIKTYRDYNKKSVVSIKKKKIKLTNSRHIKSLKKH